jgi:hypothetical protein
MPNALDAFRAQREADNQVHARLTEVAALVERLRQDVDAVSHNRELRTLLAQEQRWLEQTQPAVVEVRRWREIESRRFWPGVIRRWTLALTFALASAAVGGAGYAWATRPYLAELRVLRARSEFAAVVEHRVLTMTPSERRQFETLMNWNARTAK